MIGEMSYAKCRECPDCQVRVNYFDTDGAEHEGIELFCSITKEYLYISKCPKDETPEPTPEPGPHN